MRNGVHGMGLLHRLLLFVCAVMLVSCQLDDDEGDSGTTAIIQVGDAVPDFSLSGSDGKDITASSLAGRVYILSFFDTGCPDCQREFAVLQRLYDKYGTTVPILNVPRSQPAGEVQQYWDKVGLTMPYYTASDRELYYKFATCTIPRTYVVDHQGRVNAAFDDSPIADYETLDTALQQLLRREK